MNYVIESLLVGIYTAIIYFIISPFIKNIYALLLVVGFLKHLLGYFLNIHTWYCNNGDACLNKDNNNNYTAIRLHLIRDSLYDAVMFLIIGSVLLTKINNIVLFFTIGVLLHIISEHLLVHKYFCNNTCKKI
jgi:hypothetical protein